jgi:hypothetical protein
VSSQAQNVQPARAVGVARAVVVVGVVVDVVVDVVAVVDVVGVVEVVVVATALISHHFTVPGTESPNVLLLQSTPPVNVRGVVNVPFAP